MQSFNLNLLHEVLDERRRKHGLTWSALAAEVKFRQALCPLN